MKKFVTCSALALLVGSFGIAHAQQNGGFQGPGIVPTTVAEAKKMSDDTNVVLVGSIIQNLGDEKYSFKDATDSVTVEIDNEDWNGINVTPNDVIEIRGQVDKDMFGFEIDVDGVALKK